MLEYATELYGLEFGCGQEATTLRNAYMRTIRYRMGKENAKEKIDGMWVLPENRARELIKVDMRVYFEDKADPTNAGVRSELRKEGKSRQKHYDDHRDDWMAELSDIEIDARDDRLIALSLADDDAVFRAEVLSVLDVLIDLSTDGTRGFNHARFRKDFDERWRIASYDEDDLTPELRSRWLELTDRLEHPMRYLEPVEGGGPGHRDGASR